MNPSDQIRSWEDQIEIAMNRLDWYEIVCLTKNITWGVFFERCENG